MGELRRIEELAARVSDGDPIDWDEVTSDSSPAERELIRELRVIHGVAQAKGAELSREIVSSDSHTATAQQGRSIGPFRSVRPLGRGGMGEVFAAWDGRRGREVALKVVAPELAGQDRARARFVREASLACRISHPYVATVLEVMEVEGEVVIVMERIHGQRLDELLDPRPERSTLVRWAVEIAEALAAIHAAHVVHRDLKPGNVMVAAHGHVKVMDFGVARGDSTPSTETPDPPLTGTGDAVGTVRYMSPEQLSGDRVDARADIFSFGVLLCEVLTGRHPFLRSTPHATAAAILNEPPSLDAALPATDPLCPLILRCLEKNPGSRPADGAELLAALRAALGMAAPPPVKVFARRMLWGVVGVLAAAVLVAALKWPLFPPRIHTEPAVLVLPLSSVGGDGPEGSVLATLLRTGLSRIPRLQVVGTTRTDELLATGTQDTWTPKLTPSVVSRLTRTTSSRFVVTGTWSREPGTTSATIEVQDARNPNRVITASAGGASLSEVARALCGEIETKLGQAGIKPPDASQAAIFPVGTTRDDALVAAELGRRDAAAGRFLDADRHYAAATAADASFFRAYLERAQTLFDVGEIKAAGEALAAAETAAERPSDRLRLEADLLKARIGEDRGAETRVTDRLLATYADDPEAWLQASRTHSDEERNVDALHDVDEALRTAPAEPIFLLQKAKVLTRLRRFDEAEASVAAAQASLGPGSLLVGRVHLQRGAIAQLRRDLPAARSAYGQALDWFMSAGQPVRASEARRSLGQVDVLEGKFDAAIEELDRAVAQARAAGHRRLEEAALDSLGAALLQKGAIARAEPILRQTVALARDIGHPSIAPFLNLGNLLHQKGDPESADLAQEAARNAAHAGDRVRRQKADLLFASTHTYAGRLEEAERGFAALVAEPDLANSPETQAWTLTSQAEVLGFAGRLDAAIDLAGRGMDLHRKVAVPANIGYGLVTRAQLERLAGDVDGARKDLRDATEIGAATRSDDLAARCALESGLLALDAGDTALARRSLESALSAEPVATVRPIARGALALCLARTGQRREAVSTAEVAVRESRALVDQIRARLDLAEVLLDAGRKDAALRSASLALADARRAGMRWEIARAACLTLKCGKSREGAEAIRSEGRAALEAMLRDAPRAAASLKARGEFRSMADVLRIQTS